MFLKNRNISSKIKRSKVTDYAALSDPSSIYLKDDTNWTIWTVKLEPLRLFIAALSPAGKGLTS